MQVIELSSEVLRGPIIFGCFETQLPKFRKIFQIIPVKLRILILFTERCTQFVVQDMHLTFYLAKKI